MRTMDKKKIGICLGFSACLLFVIAVVCFMTGSPMMFVNGVKLKNTLQALEEGDRVFLNDIVPFEWECVYTFEPYQSREEIEEVLGFQSRRIKENNISEGMEHLLFVKGDRVTASILGYSENLGYSIRFAAKEGKKVTYAENAEFTVTKSGEVTVLTYAEPEDEAIADEGQEVFGWSEAEIKNTFAQRYPMSEGTEIIDCEVISDGAAERAGAVLLKDADTGMAEVAFMDMEGYFKKIGLSARPAPEPEFTYMGNGVVTFRLLTDEGESYTSEIVFTKKDNEIKYVRKDSMD